MLTEDGIAVAATTTGKLAVAAAATASKRKTSPESAPTSLTVFAAGDIADCGSKPPQVSMAARTAELVMNGLAKDGHAMVLTMGDNTYPVGAPTEFDNCYAPTWGQFKAHTLPAPGNHDYGVPLALGYYGYFGELAGPSRRGYYSIDAGGWHIISLNSNLKGVPLQQQWTWLKQDLEANKHRCTLAYWHHPLYSSGGHGNNLVMKTAWQILQEAKADLVLAGHDHDYERFAPQNADGQRDDAGGLRSFVVGTGGATLSPLLLAKPNSEVRDNSANGVLKLNLRENAYDWEFVGVPGSTFNDKGSASCHVH
jgi:3',5'-cyclic AMP phosphodiesterase CpdA